MLLFAQESVAGVVMNDSDVPVAKALVININSGRQEFSNANGNFFILANPGDEIRVVKEGYERASKAITLNDFQNSLKIILNTVYISIQEVEIGYKVTGNLGKDAAGLAKSDKAQQLRKDLGLPPPPEKPRETPPPTVKEVGIVGFAASSLNLITLYKNISGDARRMRSQYKYEDLQENVLWMRDRLDPRYFSALGIPADKIDECLAFSINSSAEVRKFIKAKNISGAAFAMEPLLAEFVKRSNSK